MKHTFEFLVALTYEDKAIDVEVELTDSEVARIKEMIAESKSQDEENECEEDEVAWQPEPSLLAILEENDKELFDRFWAAIMPKVFVELLINGMKNYGEGLRVEEDDTENIEDYRSASFERLYALYGDAIEMEHSCCCICRIPREWIPRNE